MVAAHEIGSILSLFNNSFINIIGIAVIERYALQNIYINKITMQKMKVVI